MWSANAMAQMISPNIAPNAIPTFKNQFQTEPAGLCLVSLSTPPPHLLMSSCEATPLLSLTHCCSWNMELFLWATFSGTILFPGPLLRTTFSCCSLLLSPSGCPGVPRAAP